jgi:hypothetical protein
VVAWIDVPSTVKPGGIAIVARWARLGEATEFVRVIVYDAGALGFTCDGVDVAVKASPSAAAAPDVRSRQAPRTTKVSWRRFNTKDPSL